MNRLAIKKNILDLSYKRNLQLINAILILGGGSIIASFTGLILNLAKAFQYSVILFLVSIATFTSYKLINKKLKSISLQIDKLA